jgi:hypothetical protein
LRYNEEAKKRAQAEAEAKAKVFADDFNYTNAMNTHDNPLVKQFAQFQIKRIGSYVNNNPDWQTNVQKRAEYQQLVRELKDNPDLQRGLATDDAMKKMNEFSADPKNASLKSSSRWKEIEEEKQNYILFGNQKGKEAAETEGKKAFVFTAINKIDTQKVVTDAANNLELRDRKLTKGDYSGSIGVGATISDVSFDRAKVQAEALLKDNDNMLEFGDEWANMSKDSKKIYDNDITNWVANRIQTQKGTKIDTGKFDFSNNGGGGNGLPDATPHYLEEVFKVNEGSTPYINELLPLKFDTVEGKYTYKPSPKGIRVLTNDNGKTGLKQISGMIPATDYQAAGRGRHKVIDGVRYAQVDMRVPLNNSMTQGPNALFKSNSFALNLFEGELEPENYEEIPEMAGIAHLELDKETKKPTGYAIISTWENVLSDRAHVNAYEQKAGGSSNANKVIDYTMQTMSQQEQINSFNSYVQQMKPGESFKSNGKVYTKQSDGTLK